MRGKDEEEYPKGQMDRGVSIVGRENNANNIVRLICLHGDVERVDDI